MKDRDDIGEGKDDIHIVLDDDKGSSGSHPVDHFYRSCRVPSGNASGWFMKENQFWIRRKRDPYFQSPLPAVGQGTRRYSADICESYFLDNFFGLAVYPFHLAGSLEEIIAQSLMAAYPGTDIVKNSNFLEYIRDLKGPGNTHAVEEMGRLSCNILIFENDRSRRGFKPTADNVKQGRFACPVRSNDRMPFSLLDGDVDTFQDFQP